MLGKYGAVLLQFQQFSHKRHHGIAVGFVFQLLLQRVDVEREHLVAQIVYCVLHKDVEAVELGGQLRLLGVNLAQFEAFAHQVEACRANLAVGV